MSDHDPALSSRFCKAWNDPRYLTADGSEFKYDGSGEFILYRHKRYPYWVRQICLTCINVSEIEIGCSKKVNIDFSAHGVFLIPSYSKAKVFMLHGSSKPPF